MPPEILKNKILEGISLIRNYLKLTEACHTNAKRKNKIGITGKTSTKGLKGAYASGNLAKKISVICIF